MGLLLEVFNYHAYIKHIELGAGCGNFGQSFYPDCFLTDKETNTVLKNRCKATSIFVDKIQCEATQVPCAANRFEKVIMANPWFYGFKEKEESEILLHEFHRILKPGGHVIVLANKSNPYGAYLQIQNKLEVTNCLDTLFAIQNFTLDSLSEYPGYLFLNASNNTEVRPNDKTILTCLK